MLLFHLSGVQNSAGLSHFTTVPYCDTSGTQAQQENITAILTQNDIIDVYSMKIR